MALKITAGDRTVASQRGIVRAHRMPHKARARLNAFVFS
jgi:hypothetical protein